VQPLSGLGILYLETQGSFAGRAKQPLGCLLFPLWGLEAQDSNPDQRRTIRCSGVSAASTVLCICVTASACEATKGFQLEENARSCNATMLGSQLRIQFTRDPRYADFPSRAQARELFGITVRIVTLEDLLQGKVWAWSDPERRLSKREKDRLDLVHIGEMFPQFQTRLPLEIQRLFAQS